MTHFAPFFRVDGCRRFEVSADEERGSVADPVARLTRAGEHKAVRVRVEEGFDRVAYVNLDFVVGDASGLWAAVRAELKAVPGLAGSAIVCCQGEYGWDDYLLLHHFDPAESGRRVRYASWAQAADR